MISLQAQPSAGRCRQRRRSQTDAPPRAKISDTKTTRLKLHSPAWCGGLTRTLGDSLATVVLLHKILGTLNSSNSKPFSRAAFRSICRALMPSSCFSIGGVIRWRLRIQGIQLGSKAFSRTDQGYPAAFHPRSTLKTRLAVNDSDEKAPCEEQQARDERVFEVHIDR